MQDTACAARGAEPLAFCSWRWGVAGRVDLPAEVGGGGPKGRRQGGKLPPNESDSESSVLSLRYARMVYVTIDRSWLA